MPGLLELLIGRITVISVVDDFLLCFRFTKAMAANVLSEVFAIIIGARAEISSSRRGALVDIGSTRLLAHHC